MPTPITVTCATIRAGRIVRLGGVFNDKPWSLAISYVIAELSRPAERRQWDFVVEAHGGTVPLAVRPGGVEAPGVDPLSLPEIPPHWRDDK
jgi:hypothetical protein